MGGSNFRIDPKVTASQIKNDLNINSVKSLGNENHINAKAGNWEHIKCINNLEIFNNAYAIVILTEWDEFRELKWTEIVKKMVPPAWVFDSRSIINTEAVKEAGLNLWRIGDGLDNQ